MLGLFILFSWLALGVLVMRNRRQEAQRLTQRQRYLKPRLLKEKKRATWLAFYTRLETLIGKTRLQKYRWYWLLSAGGLFAALLSQGMAALTALVLVAVISLLTAVLAFRHFEQLAISEFNAQMPDIIDSMERAVKVGAPLHDIFWTLSEQYHGSAKRLFLAMHDRLKLGHSVERVMQFAAQQMPSQEFHFLTTLLSLQSETGGKLSHMLKQLGQTLRERSLMESRVRTITSESRTSAKVLAILPPVLIGVLYGSAKEHFDYLLRDGTGQWILLYVVLSVTSGLLLIRQLTKFKG
ncbi:type II secretion system F family protein [Vibrio navarrensis]|uniref:type II secretion system F family protein n=1 Tax=Vibrio navarrensis TaxID=29495 RepID=UPI001866580A|nr:type II secretion system F family protein [Vibrio navarrensis]MBE3651102.1 pilus assembly protein TadB [Vibrio navarrensis]